VREKFTQSKLDRCISCGYCLPACPTYQLTGEEQSSPRGRITLMRALQDGRLPFSDEGAQEQASFCLGCRACEPVCPAGVEYGVLLEEWRDITWRGRKRPLIIKALFQMVSSPWRVRLMSAFAPVAKRHYGKGEYHLALGCFERRLFPKVSKVVARLAPEVSIDPSQGCCGALHAHNGDLEGGKALAKELGEKLPGTILSTAGGCAAHLSSVLGKERVQEFSQWWSGQVTPILRNGKPIRIGFQDSCHLRNGMGVFKEPRKILAQLGEYVEVPNAQGCCGAAGSYSLIRARDSKRVLAPKVEAIKALHLDYLVTVNPGCTRQLKSAMRKARLKTKVVHIAELIALTS
jgi:glycolate oxidase iron-sulfur subunit